MAAAALKMIKAQQEMLPVPNTAERSYGKVVRERIAQYTRADGAPLAESKAPDFGNAEIDALSLQVKLAVREFQRGHRKQALQILERKGGVADPTRPEVQLALRKLFPERSDKPIPQQPAGVMPLVATTKLIYKVIKKLQGSAAGPSGQTLDFLQRVRRHKLCRAGTDALINELLAGRLPKSVQPVFCASRLVPLDKEQETGGWELTLSAKGIPAGAQRVCISVGRDDGKSSATSRTECVTNQVNADFSIKINITEQQVASTGDLSFALEAKPLVMGRVTVSMEQLKASANRPLTLHLQPEEGKFAAVIKQSATAIVVLACKKIPRKRPITVGEVVTRVASSCAVALLASEMPDVFLPFQYAVGIKGGLEAVVHRARRVIESGFTLIDYDFMDAFNTTDTAEALEELKKIEEFAPICPLVWWLYENEAPVYVHDRSGRIVDKLVSKTGPRQGGGTGTLLFCVSVLKTFRKATAATKGGVSFSIVDNFSVAGDLNKLEPSYSYLKAYGADGGHKLRLEKCVAHNFADPVSLSSCEWIEDSGMKVNSRATKYLGAVLGTDLKEMQAMVMQQVEELGRVLDLLDHPLMPKQIALSLIPLIDSRFNYTMRVNKPSVTLKAATRWDQLKLNKYCKLVGVAGHEITPELRQMVFTPIKLGGVGIQSSVEQVDGAYLSSLVLCAPLLTATLPGERVDFTAATASLGRVKASLGAEARALLPQASAEDLLQRYADSSDTKARKEAVEMQHEITAARRRQKDTELHAAAVTNQQKAHLSAIQARGATLIRSTIPTAPHLRLTNAAVSYHERMCLGLPPVLNMPLHCKCNEPNGQFASNPFHALDCIQARGTTVTRRHDALKYVVAKWVSDLGGVVKVEPRKLHAQGRKCRKCKTLVECSTCKRATKCTACNNCGNCSERRPDLLIELGGQYIAWDVTVRRACCPSHVDVASKGIEKVLEQAEREKHRAYDRLAESIGATFVAFAVESTGGFGAEALKFVKELIALGAKVKNVWAPHEVVQGIYRSIAIAVANGNADILEANLRDCRAWD